MSNRVNRDGGNDSQQQRVQKAVSEHLQRAQEAVSEHRVWTLDRYGLGLRSEETAGDIVPSFGRQSR